MPTQVVNCVKGGAYDSDGCDGGWSDEPFDWAYSNPLVTERLQPYRAADGYCSLPSGYRDSGNAVQLGARAQRVSSGSQYALMQVGQQHGQEQGLAAVLMVWMKVKVHIGLCLLQKFLQFSSMLTNLSPCRRWPTSL